MKLPNINVVGSPVTALPAHEQIQVIVRWAQARVSRVVCVANVHMLMEARWQTDLENVLKNADMVAPDGMPLVWMMRLLGAKGQDRLPGVDILISVCREAQAKGVSVYFLGAKTPVLEGMRKRLMREFQDLTIAGMEPLPFRPLTPQEDEELIDRVNNSGAGIVLIALGCPKQEYWIANHKNKINAVMIGLGGAFPVFAGVHKRAPKWVRDMGLEWLYRLVQEPRRLWHRYVTTIPPFIYFALKQLLVNQQFHAESVPSAIKK